MLCGLFKNVIGILLYIGMFGVGLNVSFFIYTSILSSPMKSGRFPVQLHFPCHYAWDPIFLLVLLCSVADIELVNPFPCAPLPKSAVKCGILYVTPKCAANCGILYVAMPLYVC